MFLLKVLLYLDGKAVKLHHSLNGEVSNLFRNLGGDRKHITHLKGHQDPQPLKCRHWDQEMWENSEHDLTVFIGVLSLWNEVFGI